MPTILIVDDDEYVARTSEAMLRDLQPVVLQAHTAADGLRAALESSPDLVLLDVGLPDGDGFALTRQLRAEPTLAGLRIVLVTGHELDPDESVRAGADGILRKPIRIEELRGAVDRLLRDAGAPS
jgi:DNA-binding response OmpR family regulator